MGWPVPTYAHLPMLHGEDGAKLSKRHGAQGIHEFEALGYLPEAMRNYLLRLGWSHGDDEIISTDQAIEWFNLESIGKSPARVDFKKLDNLNGHYIREADNGRLASEVQATRKRQGGAPFSPEQHKRLVQAMPGLKERAKTLLELTDAASYLFATRPLKLDDKANKLLTEKARQTLGKLAPALQDTDWTAQNLESAVRQFAEGLGIKLGDVAQPLRAALTGKATSPPIFDVLSVLGREESLARIADQAA
jgi:glutamyl-tRNA synthetase